MKYALLRFVDILTKLIIVCFITLVILLATTISLVRYYLPLIENYHEDILELINSRVDNFDINAVSIRGNIDGFSPEIELYNVTVTAKGHDEVISVNELRLSIDLIRTLSSQRLFFERLYVSNLDLLLVQSNAKLWGLRTVATKSTSEPLKVKLLVDQLWAIDNLSIQNINVTLDSYDLPKVKLPSIDINIVTRLNNKKLSLTVAGQSAKHPLLALYARTRYNPYDERFSFDSDMLLNEVDVVKYLPLLSTQYHLNKFTASAKMTLNYAKEKLVAEGFLDVNDFSYRLNKAGIEELSLNDIDTQIRLSLSNSRQFISFNNTKLSKDGQHLSLPHGQIVFTPQQQNFYIDSLHVTELTGFIRHLWQGVDNKAMAYLNGLNPAGNLNKIHVSVDERNWEDFSLVASADNINVDFYRNIPEIRNASGQLALSAMQGEFDIQSEGFGLHLKQIFKQGFQLDHTSGLLKWRIYDEALKGLDSDKASVKRLYLSGDYLKFQGGIGSAEGEFVLDLPLETFTKNSMFSPPILSLQIGIDDTQEKYIPQFLPLMLSDKLQHWLTTNIQSARVSRADFIYHGSASRYSTLPRVTQLKLAIDDASVSYLEHWPSVERIQGELVLDDTDIVANVSSAKVQGVKVKQATLSVKKNNQGVARLNIDADYQASIDDAYRLLSIEPIAQPMNYALSDWQVQGKQAINGDVHIDLPLVTARKKSKQPALNVVVNAKLNKVSANHVERDLAFSHLQSTIRYSFREGLSAKKLSFKFLDEGFTGSISSFHKAGSVYNTRLNFQGGLSKNKLMDWFDQPAFSLTSGALNAEGYVYFGKQGSGIKLHSDLKGLALNLPDPFFKDAASSMPFTLSLPFSGKNRILTAKLNDLANIQFRMGDHGIDAGRIILGIKHAPFEKKKLIIGGQIKELDVEQWLTFVEKYTAAAKAATFDQSHSARKKAKGKSVNWNLSVDALSVRHLKAFGQQLERAQISVSDRINYWLVSLNQEKLTLKARIPTTDKPINLDVQYADLSFIHSDDVVDVQQANEAEILLDLVSAVESEIDSEIEPQTVEPQEDVQHIVSVLSSTKMAQLPDINVQINQLNFGDDDFGGWEFELRASDRKVTLGNLKGQFRHLQLMANESGPAFLSWNLDDERVEGEAFFSLFRGRLQGDNFSDVLLAWGYPELIISESFYFDIDVKWLGDPTDVDFESLYGTVSSNMTKGSFVDAPSSSTGALKFISALSLSNILRRVKLDFTDLTDKGLSYDTLNGKIRLDSGVVLFDKKSIEIVGASSKINLLGQVDFMQENMDLELSVTLPLASNLPWIVALAAGLPTAAGVYIISKLLQTQVEKLSSAVYRVSGSFEDPEVKFLRLFDTH